MSRAPSIVPQDANHDTYIVLDASGVWVGRGFRETDDEDDRETLIHDLLDGNHGRPVRIVVFNTAEGAMALADSVSLRRAALLHKVPYYTALSGAVAAAQGIKAYLGGDLEVRALQSYFGGKG